MGKRESELDKLEKLALSFGNMGDFTRMMEDSYSRLESRFEDINSRLARVNELLRQSLVERNRLANYMNSILESLDAGVIVTDKNGLINIFNSAAERITGIKAEDALGRYHEEVLEDSASSDAAEVLAGSRQSASGEREFVMADGSRISVGYSVCKLRQSDNSEAGGMVEILHDLSEIKNLEHNLKRVSTLAALGEMAATVAHEIRNPIAGISGFTSLLLRDIPPDDKNRTPVEKIKGGVQALEAIVEKLLDYTRTVKPEVRNVEPLKLVNEAVAQIGDNVQQGRCSIAVESESKTLRAEVDPHLFKQIVINLVRNAVQAQPTGGRVVLRLSRAGRPGLILKVEDSGPGIPDHDLEKLFTPFFTTRTSGTGLGLATVKKLVELHGGSVTAANRPDGGAVFTVQIPNPEGASDET
jgi:PAS domain S-box-containing protein